MRLLFIARDDATSPATHDQYTNAYVEFTTIGMSVIRDMMANPSRGSVKGCRIDGVMWPDDMTDEEFKDVTEFVRPLLAEMKPPKLPVMYSYQP